MDKTKDILSAAGIVHRRGRFLKPPASTYAVYTEDIETNGPDRMNMLYTHSCTIELYEPYPDDESEAALESRLDSEGIRWEKQDRYWIQDEQRYQVIYEYDYIEKRRITE